MTEQAMIAWSSDLETGHPEIDAQHKTLVESINRLHTAIGEGKGEEELGWCLSFLKAYTRVHFRAEEATFSDLPQTDVAGHIAAHQELQKNVDELFRKYVKGELQLLPETLAMLERWLVDHILGEDRDMVRAIRDQRLG